MMRITWAEKAPATPAELRAIRDRAMADYLTGYGDPIWTGWLLLAIDGGA